MNKKILIGSILAVVILILVSFTSVIGYQTTKSSTIARASPLFTVRSSRAIDEESRDLSCDYVGREEEITISLPIYNSRNIRFQNVIDVITRMNGEEFNKFMFSAINKFQRSNVYKDGQIRDIIQVFQHMIKISSYPKNLTSQCQTIGGGCLLYQLWILLQKIIDFIIFLPSMPPACTIWYPCP